MRLFLPNSRQAGWPKNLDGEAAQRPTSPAQIPTRSHSRYGVIDTPQREALNDEYASIHTAFEGDPLKDKPAQRIHSDAPAEGDEAADPTDVREHSQDPAEGADPDDD